MVQPSNPRPARATKRPARFSSEGPATAKRNKTTHAATGNDHSNDEDEEDTSVDEAAESVEGEDRAREVSPSSPTVVTEDTTPTVAEDSAANADAAEGTVAEPTVGNTPEAKAVALLSALGIEPGALVNMDLSDLTTTYKTLFADRLAAQRALAPQSTPAEAKAVALLSGLGVEPGALVNMGIADLNTTYRTLLDDRAAAERASEALAHRVQEDGTPARPAVIAAPAPIAVSTSAGPSNAPVAIDTTNPTVVAPFPNNKAAALELMGTLHVPADRIKDLELSQIRRVYILINFVDKARLIFAIDKICVSLDFGIPTSFNNTSNIVCEKGTSRPITVWVVGEVTNYYFFNNEGYPATRVAIAVQPLSSGIHPYCKTLLNSLCMPRNHSSVADNLGPDQFRATRWMTRQGQRGQSGTVAEFTDYYDARVALRDKAVMEKLSVEQIKEHDIVLVEARMGRYSSDESPGGKGGRRTMNKWQSFFDMQSIFLIQNATVATETAPMSTLVI